jgi:hypothetical protein
MTPMPMLLPQNPIWHMATKTNWISQSMMTKDTLKYWTENNVCMNSDLPLDWCTHDVACRTKKTFNQKKNFRRLLYS